METSGHFQCGLCNLRETDGRVMTRMMIKEFIEKQFSILLDKDAGDLDKSLKSFLLFTYGLTAVQLQKYILIAINIFFPTSSDAGEIYLKIMASILTISSYFLLIYMSGYIRLYADLILGDILRLVRTGLGIKSNWDKMFDDYKYNRGIVLKYEVKNYLDINEDNRIKELYEDHGKFVNRLIQRKEDAMAISILLCINFYLNQEALINYAKPYLLIVIFLAIWSALLPDVDLNFMYIRNNKIRVKESLPDSNYPPIQ
jgi:hypothetical protein